MIVKMKDGSNKSIPQDYAIKHLNSDSYVNQEGKKCKYMTIKNGRDKPHKLVPQNSDDPVFRFVNDLKNIDFDLETIPGIKHYLAAIVEMSIYDNYGYIDVNSITYAANTLQKIVDVLDFDLRLSAVEEAIIAIKSRISDPDLLDEINGIISIYTPPTMVN